jgi:hypothetical protein
MRPIIASWRGSAVETMARWFGTRRERSWMSALISARALSTVTPSRNRARPVRLKRNDAVARVDCAAFQTSLRASGKLNAAGITPITSVGWPSSEIERPTMPGSPPNRPVQRPCDSTATDAAPVAPSASVNHRPRAGDTRRTDASDGVARVTMMRSGSPRPVNVIELES